MSPWSAFFGFRRKRPALKAPFFLQEIAKKSRYHPQWPTARLSRPVGELRALRRARYRDRKKGEKRPHERSRTLRAGGMDRRSRNRPIDQRRGSAPADAETDGSARRARAARRARRHARRVTARDLGRARRRLRRSE